MSKPSELVFFIDRALGKAVPEALRKAGAKVEIHRDHFAEDALDDEWLPVVAERGWVVLTKDENISIRQTEVRAIARSRAKVFILVSGKLTREPMANLFVSVLDKLKKFTQGNTAPFIAKIYKNGTVKKWQNSTQLLKLLKTPKRKPT